MKSKKEQRLSTPRQDDTARRFLGLRAGEVASRGYGAGQSPPLFRDSSWEVKYKKAALEAQEEIATMARTARQAFEDLEIDAAAEVEDREEHELEEEEVLELEEAVPEPTALGDSAGPFARVQKAIDAVLSSGVEQLTQDEVELARACAEVEEQRAINRKYNADAEVVEGRAAKIEAEARQVSAEAEVAEAAARKAEAAAASEPKRQRNLRGGEVVTLVMRVILTVFALGIVLAGFLVNPLLIPSGAAVAGGAYGVKHWWDERKRPTG